MGYMDDILGCPGLATTLTVRSFVQTFNKWGDEETETPTDTTFVVNLQSISAEDKNNEEGIFFEGDIWVFFSPTSSNLSRVVRGSHILTDVDGDGTNETYEIMNVVHEPEIAIGDNHIEVIAKRI